MDFVSAFLPELEMRSPISDELRVFIEDLSCAAKHRGDDLAGSTFSRSCEGIGEISIVRLGQEAIGLRDDLDIQSEGLPVHRDLNFATHGGLMPLKTNRNDVDITIKDDGQQKDYLVLSDEELSKGFIRPVRKRYRHTKCGSITVMGQKLAETYAAKPNFYSGTFCVQCGTHFPVGINGEFVWVGADDQDGDMVGT